MTRRPNASRNNRRTELSSDHVASTILDPGPRVDQNHPESNEARDRLTVANAARILREAVKDKSYRVFPLGQEAGDYLRSKRKRLTEASYRDYESCLDKLARYFADLQAEDFEPPVGTERLEEFLDFQWGSQSGRTYNKNLSILRDFFKFQVLRVVCTVTRRFQSNARRPELPTGRRLRKTTGLHSCRRTKDSATNSASASFSTTASGRARCSGSSSSTSTTSGSV